jgi:hypothetical protein
LEMEVMCLTEEDCNEGFADVGALRTKLAGCLEFSFTDNPDGKGPWLLVRTPTAFEGLVKEVLTSFSFEGRLMALVGTLEIFGSLMGTDEAEVNGPDLWECSAPDGSLLFNAVVEEVVPPLEGLPLRTGCGGLDETPGVVH